MLNSTLLNILSKFTPAEIKEFSEFVASPFFNKNENTAKLYEHIKKYYPEFNDKKLEKEYVYSKLYSKSKYNDGFMRTVIFNLAKLAENYLAYINFSKNELNKGINLLEELNERKLEKVFLKNYSEIEKEVDKITVKDTAYFYKKLRLDNLMHTYSNWSRFKAKNLKDFEDSRLFDEIRNQTNYFLASTLMNYRFLLVKREFEQLEFNFEMIDSIIHFLTAKENEYIDIPIVKTNLYEILLVKEKKDKYYYLLKDILMKETKTLSHNNRYSLHNVLQSFCTWKTFEGKKEFISERFTLYNIALEQKLYAGNEDIYFDEIMFGSIVLVGIYLKKYDWVASFIEKYNSMLSPENTELTVNFSLARLYFAKGEYEKALYSLNSIKSIKHIQFKLAIKDLTMMVYYELSMLRQALYTLDSYRHLLAKSKDILSEARFERVGNFLKFFTRLAKLREKSNPFDVDKLTKELNGSTNTIEREWLLEKANDLA